MIDYSPPAGSKADWTIDQVREFAFRTDDNVLYTCIKMYDYGYCSWAQAMQAAALESCKVDFSNRRRQHG